jgi:hypothetical protein
LGIPEVDTSNEGCEVAPQKDYDQESHYLTGQLRVSEDMIMAATRRIDDTHALMADYCWRASVTHDSADEGFVMDDLHTLRESVSMMRTDYQQLLKEKDYLLGIGEMYHRALTEQELEVDRLTQELVSTRGFLSGTQTLQEPKYGSDELLKEIRPRSTSSILVETQICQSVTLPEDVGGLAEETHLGEHADITHLQQHLVMKEHLHRFSSCMGDERWRLVDQQLEGLLPIVLDDWDSVMSTRQYLWISMDELLVESLGLTKAYDIFQSYSQLQMFLLAFHDTFIIDNSMRRDRQWLRTWGVARSRPPDMSVFTAFNRIEVDRHKQPVETWCVMVSIIGQMIAGEDFWQ